MQQPFELYILCYNPKAVKIPSLLAQYLYGNQRLDLPGIGTFHLDTAAISALQNTKQRSTILEGVSFENNTSCNESPDLIAFIAEKTGKMKALASADLDSHLQLAQQFLNMGKPFSFEGIMILTKAKAGDFEFTPIMVSTEKIKEHHVPETPEPTVKEEAASGFEPVFSLTRGKFEWRKPVIGLLLLCGVGVTVWGGYVISKRNEKSSMTAVENVANNAAITDTIQKQDSITNTALPENTAPEKYKYILETAKKKRAIKRYNQLKEIRWNVQLETNDSLQFKLFMMLPAYGDTTKTIDSLRMLTGRKVHIEYQR